MNFVDPSGHVACDNDEGVCNSNPQKNKPSQGGLPSGRGGDDESQSCALNDYSCQAENADKFRVGVELDLTAAQVDDLLSEINWWLKYVINPASDFSSYVLDPLQIVGAGSIAAMWILPAEPLVGSLLLLGAVAWAGDQIISNTQNDLQDIRYQLAMESSGGKNGVKIEMGGNVGQWGVDINGQETVSHNSWGGTLTPKGTLTLTPIFMFSWYMFDYGR
jgi:hypothetical protein